MENEGDRDGLVDEGNERKKSRCWVTVERRKRDFA